MSGWFSDVLNGAAAIAQVILSLSPAPDIYNVHRHKDIGEMAALPLVAMAVNNHACHSGVQPARAIMYSAIYFRWSSKPKRKELIKLFARAFALHCALSLYFVLGAVGVTGQTKSDVGTWFGYVGVVINVWMYASPLGTLKHVVKTKNSASIPINLSVMLLISTLLWLGTGILDSDLFNAGINSVGATLSLIQIVVYFYNRSNRNDELLIQQDLISKEDDMSIVIATPKDNTTITPLDTSVYKPMASPRT
ncbi:hypothetical protein L917_14688 [Phytophthora nicotianae]|uniref:Sugar transporter SWEET1 n=1 Tax=Phytophthora nicotianae TaxID=4792 RepID=W2KN89_PHYNI|nr:hypothetical protein L917_14688 [Phytophthora nicotianae]